MNWLARSTVICDIWPFMPETMEYDIRPACESDISAIYRLIGDLAEYEHLGAMMVSTEEDLGAVLFGADAFVEVLVAEVVGQVVGFALFYKTFSTFVGRPGLYLEDLYVVPEYRGRGVGKGLLSRLATLALEREYGRLEWSVLNWNAPAIEFYCAHGARAMTDWTVYRLSGDAVAALAKE